jgi:predicted TPR repeat methyltransferase
MDEQAGRLFRSPTLALAPAEDGYWAYDVQTAKLHHLNPLAALILELCDGSQAAAEISAELAPLLGQSQPDSCTRWIENAIASGLLSNGAPALHPKPAAASDFASAARDLRCEGLVLGAFVCQYHAAVLVPDDEDYWAYLGELAHIVQRRADARMAYERYLELHGSDPEVEHLLISLRDEAPPPRASDSCIQRLYARFSGFYEDNVVGQLHYEGPAHIAAMLKTKLGDQSHLNILDLGCGTGLGGRELRRWARHLVGIDLSPEMIELAKATGLYDELEVGEITSWLSETERPELELIAAFDSMIYFGDLRQVLIPASHRLFPGGRMVFSVERAEKPSFQLTDSGRYQHSRQHISEAATEAGFLVEEMSEAILRYEYGEPVHGLVALLRRPL